MADEPRRSGRATKGQHNKDRDIAEDATPAKKKGKGKGAKSAKPVQEEEEEGEIIRCICGEYEEEEDNPRSMICCDKCEAWQHNMCMGLPEDYEPEKYYCEQCRPSDHKDLLAAIARGEKPWVEALKRREAAAAEKNSKKKGKKGRKSAGAAAPVEVATPVPAQAPTPVQAPDPAPTPAPVEEPVKSGGHKRKAEETPTPEVKNKKVRSTPVAESGTRAASQSRKASTPVTQPSNSEPAKQESNGEGVVTEAKELTNATRRSAANSLIKLFTDQIKELIKKGAYTAPAGSSPQEAGTQLGLQVEHALYQAVPQDASEPGDAYKAQLRAISFNVKKNPALGERIVGNSISPQELASMDAKDMASEEQQKKDAALKEEMDKQHTIVHEQGPRIRRTHKGEEYVDEANQVAAESTTSRAPRKQSTIDQSGDAKSPTVDDKSAKGRQPLSVNTQTKPRPSADPRRKSSSNFDIDKVWSGVQGSPDGETPRRSEAPHHGSPQPMSANADPDIDNLLKDEENESEPYSPKEFNEEGIVWRGSVNGGNLGRFHTTAKFAAGAKPDADTLRLTWEKVIPAEIVIHGRIQPQKADDYLCGLQYSSTSDLIIVTMAEPRNKDDHEGFEKLFRYFKQKNRYGVGVQHENPAIKDIYLLPMDAGQQLPTFMQAIETDFPDPVLERTILVPIVIKNSELPHNMNAAGQPNVMSPSIGPPVAQTPITPQEGRNDIPQNGVMSYGHTTNGTPQPPQQSPLLPQSQWGAPTQTPQQSSNNQAPTMPPNPSPAVSAAHRILGPQLANSPGVQQLLRSAPNVGDTEMRIVHDCIKENAQAANDLSLLTRMLQIKSLQARESQTQGQSQAQTQSQNQAQVQQEAAQNAPTSDGAQERARTTA